MLLKMSKTKNRRQSETVLISLKDLFMEEILSNKKLLSFYQNYTKSNPESNESTLLQYYIDDTVHKLYLSFLETLEQIVINDPVKQMKKKYMQVLLEMITKRPEREEKILDVLINKLGDPDVDVTNSAIKTLKQLQMNHPKMSLIIFQNIRNFMSRCDKETARYYSLVYLTQMFITNNPEYIEENLKYFFDLFNTFCDEDAAKKHFLNKKKVVGKKLDKNINSPKFLSLIVKRIYTLCKFSSENKLDYGKINNLINEKIDTLFKLSHSENIKLRIEVLKLIFMIGISSQSNKNYIDRFYKSLYEMLLLKEIAVSKGVKEFLKLVMQSLSIDTNITRVSAILKRLLQVSSHAEPPFICCSLIIASQVLRAKSKMWKMIENIKETESKFDFSKRDPTFTNADEFPLYELNILTTHYHPTVRMFSNFILSNYNKDTISYEGDPLLDFSLVNFLEKFILKNARVKSKDKKKQKSEEQKLKNFVGDDEEEDIEEAPAKEEKKGMEIDFIKKFNEIEKVKSSRIGKKIKTIGDIDEFADKVIMDAYEKFDMQGKDVDEDVDFSNLSDQGAEELEEEDLENFEEDEEDLNEEEEFEEEEI